MKIKSSIRNLLILMGALLCFAAPSFAQIGISVSFGPPALPVYEQPVCPGDGYIWTPGYWGYAEDGGYYWIPGTWIEAPQTGYLWTPGYWGWGGSAFLFHTGYWGPTVGFYGGINYGFGYTGEGYYGGRWDHDHFYYNRAVNNVNVRDVHNVYETHVREDNNRVSYNGGNGGRDARANAEQQRAEQEHHMAPVAAQNEHREAARNNPELRATENHGRPPIAATQRANEFKGNGVVAAKEAGAPYKAPERTENHGAARTENNGAARNEAAATKPTHASEVQHETRPAPNTGNAATDKKYQAQQQKLDNQQQKDHQKLAAQQEQDHQRATQQKANDARTQQMEQRHQQQTAAMEQKHTQQQQHLEQRQPAQRSAPEAHGEKPK